MKLKQQNLVFIGVIVGVVFLVITNIVFLSMYFSKGDGPWGESSKAVAKNSVPSSVAEPSAQNSGYYQIEVDNEDSPISERVKKISQHIILPDGKVTVATIEDPASLQAQNPEFYQYAKKGDNLVYYPNGVILYDPVLDRILDFVRVFATSTGAAASKK